MRNSILASLVVVAALLIVAHVADPAAQGRQRISGEGFVSEGVPKMPNPPGPAPKRDLSGAWVGPQSNKPDPAPPMTPAGQAAFKERRGYGAATQLGRGGGTSGQPGESNDPFITCDPLGFPRNLLAHAISSRGGMLFGSAPNRMLIAYEQQRVWREIFMDGRALPKAVDVRGAPESRYYGYSVGHWENDNTLVIETTGVDERAWLDEVGHPRSSVGAHHGALHACRSVQPAVDRHGGRSEVLHEAVDIDAGELLLDEGAGLFRVVLHPVGGDPVSRHARQAVRDQSPVEAPQRAKSARWDRYVRRYLSETANIFALVHRRGLGRCEIVEQRPGRLRGLSRSWTGTR